MKKIRIMVLGVCICMTISMLCNGCSSNNKGAKKRANVKLETGEISEDSIVMAVGNEGVRYSEMLHYRYLLQRQYEGGFSKELWDYELEEGKTIGDEAKQEIVGMITQLKVIKTEAKLEKIHLSNDEIDEALQQAEAVMSSASEEDKKTYALTVQGFSEIYQENILANKMFYIATDAVNTVVSDDMTAQEKEAEIEKRLMEHFKSRYEEWLKRCEVKISEDFWDVF